MKIYISNDKKYKASTAAADEGLSSRQIIVGALINSFAPKDANASELLYARIFPLNECVYENVGVPGFIFETTKVF